MVAQQNEAKARFYLNEYKMADSLLMPCLEFWNGKHIRWQFVFYDLMEVHEQLSDCDLWQMNRKQIKSYTEMLSVEKK